jgi:hypothetical protein
VRIAAVAGEIEGAVAEMSPAADQNSRTYLVKLDLPGATGLRSGQFGRVAVPVGEASAIRVPAAAVIQRADGIGFCRRQRPCAIAPSQNGKPRR